MSHTKPLSRNDDLAVNEGDARPLEIDEEITARHMNGHDHQVRFETVSGEKFDHVRIRWPMAGFYDVDIETGKLLGGGKKGRKAASVWRIIPSDMARVRATQQRAVTERRERMRRGKRGKG